MIDDFKAELPEGIIYVYDNNSTDNTYAIAKAAGVKVKKESRQGKGNVVRTMFREIDALCYLLVDGDDTYPAKDARKMCREVLENGADMVTGDRLSSTYFWKCHGAPPDQFFLQWEHQRYFDRVSRLESAICEKHARFEQGF